MKKVLMVTYSFPPKGGGGVLRQFKFAKYLSDFEWKPFVLAGDKYSFFQDKELLKELPAECKIFRVTYPSLQKSFLSQQVSKYDAVLNNIERPNKTFKILTKSSLFHLKSIFSKILIPDIYISWVPFALQEGLSIIKKENIDVIYSIDYPCSNHVLAFFLKIITKKPWVADFKDPWIQGWGDRNPRPFPFSWLDNKLQKLILSNCDICISSDKRIDNVLKGLTSKAIWHKFFVIPNGFDKRDFMLETNKKYNKIFTITYVGTLLRDMPPFTILRAILNLIESKKIPQDAIRFVFVGIHGHIDTFINPIYQLLLKKGVIQEKGLVSHKESIRYMKDSDVLLLISANVVDSKNIVPSKIYEYLASGKPIIALVDENGACAQLIRNSNSGFVLPINDEQKIEEVILRLFEQFKNKGGLKTERDQDTNYLEPYERKNLSGRLAKVFNDITNSSRN